MQIGSPAIATGAVTLSQPNNYAGGTTLYTGAVLTVANGANGSATGTGMVILNGGTLASAPTGGTISGNVVAGYAPHSITPGGTGPLTALSLGSLTLNANSTLNFDVTGTGSNTPTINTLAITGLCRSLTALPTST